MEETEYRFLRSRELRVVLEDDKGIIGFPRISANVEILEPLCFGDLASVRLLLQEVDGKQIVYQFEISCETKPNKLAAKGTFRVACCRFPSLEDPFAILIPDFILDRLASKSG